MFIFSYSPPYPHFFPVYGFHSGFGNLRAAKPLSQGRSQLGKRLTKIIRSRQSASLYLSFILPVLIMTSCGTILGKRDLRC